MLNVLELQAKAISKVCLIYQEKKVPNCVADFESFNVFFDLKGFRIKWNSAKFRVKIFVIIEKKPFQNRILYSKVFKEIVSRKLQHLFLKYHLKECKILQNHVLENYRRVCSTFI